MREAEEEDIGVLLQEAKEALLEDPLHAAALAVAAERLAEEREDEDSLAQSLLIQARAAFRQSAWEETRENYLTALAWAQHRSDAMLEWECLHGLGLTALRQREIPIALERLFQALEVLEPLGNPAGEAEVHSAIGSGYGMAGRYREATDELREALRLAQQVGEPRILLPTLGNVATLMEVSGNLALARTRYEETLTLARQCQHVIYVAQTHASLCRVLSRLGEYTQALEHGREAVTQADTLGNLNQRVLARRSLGEAFAEYGMLEEAEHWLMEGLELAEGERVVGEWTELLRSLGKLSARQGEWLLARQYHEAALHQAVQHGNVADQAQEHRILADLCEREGDLRGAIRHLKSQIQAEEFVRREAATGEFLAAMARLDWERSLTR
jgi:tetratricopeptide (TPR) repeat protein